MHNSWKICLLHNKFTLYIETVKVYNWSGLQKRIGKVQINKKEKNTDWLGNVPSYGQPFPGSLRLQEYNYVKVYWPNKFSFSVLLILPHVFWFIF